MIRQDHWQFEKATAEEVDVSKRPPPMMQMYGASKCQSDSTSASLVLAAWFSKSHYRLHTNGIRTF